MSTIFLYEDGYGNVIDENSGPEPMDYIVDGNEFIVETVATHTEYLGEVVLSKSSLTSPILLEKLKDDDVHMKEAKPKREYMRYTVQDKARFFDLKTEKCVTAAAAAKQLGIHVQTAYRRAQQYERDPDSIFDNYRKCILTEEHKTTVINFIDSNPSAIIVEVTEHLLERFHYLKISCSTVNNFMRCESNLSLKEADFHFIERNSPAKIEEKYDWSTKGTRAIVTRPTARANTTSILSAISAAGLITVGVKKNEIYEEEKG
ncbi:hypothetical protein BD560DRAFT_442893 [Blakeslea trispora]|nr:hypothetical protein BD560DRAFT_442893 [Blakeslea trispora]